MRRKSRETAFKLVYESLFKEEDYLPEISLLDENNKIEEVEDLLEEDGLDEEEKNYSKQIAEKYFENKNEIQTLLKEKLIGYELNRVYKIDLALVIVAVCENFYLEVPKAVIINEILEISKIYSTEKSPSFINGLLKEILK